MIGLSVEAAAVTAAEKESSKPASRMALTSINPRPHTSATADPDIPAKMALATILTWASPPGIKPITARAKRKMRVVIPPAFITDPAKMKRGMATMGNELAPLTIRWKMTVKGMLPTKKT